VLLSRLPNGDPEIFATIQGEGATAGEPSVFVRLAECNLRCTWCDTKYTWEWSQYDRAEQTVELERDAIVARTKTVIADAGGGVRAAVVTGGEPLLQQDELPALLEGLRGLGLRIEIETNGTIVPRAELAALVDQWNVSPKLASSGNGERARRRPAALEWFARSERAQFKLVTTGEPDLVEIEELALAFEIPRSRILLSPEGTDAGTLAARSRWLAAECTRHGYRLGTRLHVFLWGSDRGR
jgi:7-carboxy-7-deazaguanine synthase